MALARGGAAQHRSLVSDAVTPNEVVKKGPLPREGGPPHPNLLPRGEGTLGPSSAPSAPSAGFVIVAHGFSPGRSCTASFIGLRRRHIQRGSQEGVKGHYLWKGVTLLLTF